ncbi:HTTM domain-containing protein [Pseudarthrobacter sp. PS3-L1]|uniref:HTTM domain-containing protein n=1 Tax=Pseudarthrobacter sp. PS3-L1 TaxID=3046207 RepID=UPI0024B985CE|nr:HTTM domain-containing protein [Pseudarthrobacter sp. PS3-L1]MDJ0320711.1 HTTM domain-containing protein [Pseudarthrobacter sp. PS3-L1]
MAVTSPSPQTSGARHRRPLRRWLRDHRHVPGAWLTFLSSWFVSDRHGSYGLAVMRISSGILVLGWLLANLPIADRIWGPGAAYWNSYRSVLGYSWPLDFLNNAGNGAFWAWYLVTIGLVITFILGWRTRFTTPLLFVFYAGLNAQNTAIADGGNYFFRIMLIYLVFADISRRWSLDSRRRSRLGKPETQVGSVVHNLALCMIIAQLCIVYFEAGMYKVQGSLWQNGTAIYYPLASETYGALPWLSSALTFFTWGTVLATYFTVIIQVAFPFLLFNRITRRIALLCILAMHLGIAIAMGLPFFSGVMASADAVLVGGATWLAIQQWGASFLQRFKRSNGPKPQLPPLTGLQEPVEAWQPELQRDLERSR